MIQLLADTSEAASNWNVLVVGGSVLIGAIGGLFGLVRLASGKDKERQIEPTALASLAQKIDDALAGQPDLARELGEISAQLKQLVDALDTQRSETRDDLRRLFIRMDNTDREVNQHTATLDAHAERIRALELARR